jgi:hypothetical protein
MATMKPGKPTGMTGKPAPKVDKSGKKVFSGTGSTTKAAKMPDLKKPSGVSGSTTKKAPAKPGPSIASRVADRVGTVRREARDVVTAVSSVGTAALDAARTKKAFALKQTVKDLPKQVKEVGTAAVKGKIGTAPLVTKTGKESRMTNRASATSNFRATNKKR